jgi:ERCC4-type nuclease
MTKIDYTIIIDTREQKPLDFSNFEHKGLKTGDYSYIYNGVDYSDSFALERKSGIDLFGTAGKGHKRFKAELERALKLDYFAIIIEEPHLDIINKKFEGAFRSKMMGYVVSDIIYTIHIKYKIPIFFTNSRNESKSVIKSLIKAHIKLKK